MTLEQLTQRNEKFQEISSQMAELIPGSNLLNFSTSLIRCAKKLDSVLKKVLSAKTDMSFYNQLDLLEEEIDELVYMMDRLEEANRKQNVVLITDVIKKGYELVSLYSLCCDQILEKRTQKQDEFEND